MKQDVSHHPFTSPHLLSCLFILTLLLTACVTPAAEPMAGNNSAYIEPALLATTQAKVSAIVTATSAEAAARSVTQLGGEVTSDLWLINAVAATISSRQITALAAQPGIVSVVHNKGVAAVGQDGWVSERRLLKASLSLNGSQIAPALALSDGGLFSITDKGNYLIVNADGSPRVTGNLSGGDFLTAALEGSDGTIYVAGENRRLYALNSNGSVRWTYQDGGSDDFVGGIARGPDETIYVGDEGRHLYAIDSANGVLRWQYFASQALGKFLATPAIGPDGKVYVVTDVGYLLALNSSGALEWTFQASINKGFLHTPQINEAGTIFLASVEKRLFAVNANGSLKYQFAAPDKILAPPMADAAGNVYVSASKYLVGLNPNGSQRFSVPGLFITRPLLREGSVIAAADKAVYTYDAASGAERWRYQMAGTVRDTPTIDENGALYIGSEGSELVILSLGGHLLYRMPLADKAAQSPILTPSGDIAVRVGSSTLALLGRMPSNYDGSPDVTPTENRHVYQVVNQVAIDAGADVLHETAVADNVYIRGSGVTVAVVDSGIYFDNETINTLGGNIVQQFLGQADFIEPVCPYNPGGSKQMGVQFDDHCLITDQRYSRDSYGHGSHVAGIVWNRLTDQATGTFLGVAPDANVFSVRVLDGEGKGTYATVI